MEPMIVDTHRCPRCGEVKPADEFALTSEGQGWQQKTATGDVIHRYSYCHPCNRAKAKGHHADLLRRMEQDPAFGERIEARWRENQMTYARRKGCRPRPVAYKRVMVEEEKDLRIPAEPFREWMRAMMERYECGSTGLSEVTGLPDRSIQRILYEGQDNVSIDTVDKALVREGSTLLPTLYPDLYPGLDPEFVECLV